MGKLHMYTPSPPFATVFCNAKSRTLLILGFLEFRSCLSALPVYQSHFLLLLILLLLLRQLGGLLLQFSDRALHVLHLATVCFNLHDSVSIISSLSVTAVSARLQSCTVLQRLFGCGETYNTLRITSQLILPPALVCLRVLQLVLLLLLDLRGARVVVFVCDFS